MFQTQAGFKSGLFLVKFGLCLLSSLISLTWASAALRFGQGKAEFYDKELQWSHRCLPRDGCTWMFSGWMHLKEKSWAQRGIPGGKSCCCWFKANKSSRSECLRGALMDSHTWVSLEHPALGTLRSGREICPWLSQRALGLRGRSKKSFKWNWDRKKTWDTSHG